MDTQPPDAAKIMCTKCQWIGTQEDLIPHPADEGKSFQRNVCPACHNDRYCFPKEKEVS